ncbi:glycosyltransferase family 4 protein, partial [Roseomonas sp. DSM 102946]|nr:glycosyltransferase family 4 protein [Roseomonas sp. DSM 102946]
AGSGRSADIEMRPVVPEAELPALFDAHDIYLFPSRYEPFSLTLIHALACGIPTIASRAGGNPEIVEDGHSGLLFEKGDPADLAEAIARLARDPELRARLASQGQQVGSRFTFERMAGEMVSFLLNGR